MKRAPQGGGAGGNSRGVVGSSIADSHPFCADCDAPLETYIVWYDGSLLCEPCARAWGEMAGGRQRGHA